MCRLWCLPNWNKRYSSHFFVELAITIAACDGRPRKSAPWQVRRVEEYIEVHWDQPVSVEGLAVVANASARSIFQSFRECRGYSPMNFLKQVRLRHAKELLAKPVSSTSVTNVSFACGFGNLGRFANEYQKVFGETPSETLNRSKGLPLACRRSRLASSEADI
jgi:transcriptional regulator GlxA family with amidase domain